MKYYLVSPYLDEIVGPMTFKQALKMRESWSQYYGLNRYFIVKEVVDCQGGLIHEKNK